MNQSTTFAQVATNQFDYLSSALCANTPPYKKHSSSRKFLTSSISLRLLLVMFLTLSVSASAWGAEGDTHNFSQTLSQLLNNSASVASIEIAEQSYAVKTVKITSDYNKTAGGVTMEVLVAGSSWGKATHNSNATKTFTFSGTSTKGKVVIKFTNNCGSGTGKGTFKVTTVQLVEGASVSANPYTVTFKDDNSTLTQLTAGASITLPSRDGCDGYKFVGWTNTWTAAQTTWTTTAPTIIEAGTYTPTANESLYPVYTKTEGGSSEPTAYSAGDKGDFVIASYNTSNSKWYAIPETPTLSSGKITGKEITVSQTTGGVKYVSTTNAEGYTWTIADATNGQTISDGSKYIYHSNGGVSGTNLAYGTSTSYTWKIEKETNGLTFKGMSGSTTNSRGMLFNGSEFGGYALSNESVSGYYRIQVLPIGGGSTTYYISTPDCGSSCDDAVTISKGTETNGIFTLSTTGNQSTCDGPVIVTVSNIQPAVGYQFSEITQSGINTGVTIDNTTQKVTYAKNTTGTSTIDVTFTPKEYTLPLESSLSCVTNGSVTIEYNATSAKTFTAATRDDYTCTGYWSAPSGGVQVLKADGTFVGDVSGFISGGKWVNTTATKLTPRWETEYKMTLSKGEEENGTYILSTSSIETSGCATSTTRQVTITATPVAGYEVDQITYSGDGTATITTGPTISAGKTTWVYTFAENDKGLGTFIVTFKQLPTYTVTWMANEQQHAAQIAVVGTSLTNPGDPEASTYACDDKVFVGWTAVKNYSSTTTAPNDLFKSAEATSKTIPENGITYYAVFANATTIPGTTTTTEETATLSFENAAQRVSFSSTQQVWKQNGIVFTNNQAGSSTPVADYVDPVRCYKESNIILDCSELGYITKAQFKCTSSEYASDLASSIGSEASTTTTWVTLIPKSKTTVYEISLSSGQTRISLLIVTYEKTIVSDPVVTYSDYTTTCVKLPDPVWEGATIDKTSFTVNCGERSPMTGENGAAKITFPTDKIYNFTSAITIEATTGFLVSTSQTEDANYKSLVSLSPLVGTANANTFYNNFVYVRAESPAMSEEDLSGTITIKNNKGETLQTFSVTADVTCTQYTLTLVDRGVSTEQATKYYAGETIDEAPADPEGVCTDPIHYVFDGWAAATVSEGSTKYTKVTFPYTVEGNTKFYAVYRYVEEGSADGGDYVKVTEDLDDYSGDYLIVYEAGSLALNGALVGDGLDASGNSISVVINDNTIAATDEINAANFTIAKEGDNEYSIRSASGYYIGQTTNANDLKTNSTEYYANTITLSNDDNADVVSSGAYLRYNAATGNTNLRFRYYKSDSYTSQKAIALYRKAASYLYTTSPVCGPHLAITEGKEIYVTGGNAGGTRDLVIAQQKVSYKATRLNVGPTSQVPDVKVATNGITVGGVVTSDVKVTIDQTKEKQTDGTYTITGTITVQYQPSANTIQEDIQVQLAVDYNTDAKDNFIVHARSLPSEFVIVAKSGDKWYALNGDMNNGSSANPANGQVTLDDDADPTKATYAPCNTIYTFDGLPNTGDRTYVRFQGTDGAWLWASSGTNTGIQNNVLKTTPEGSNKAYNWKLYTEDNITYRFGNANSSRQLTLNGEKFGMYASGVQDIRILPYVEKCLYNYAPTNLKVSVLKGSYVTLTWDAVAGATKYQYSTNGTTWTDAGTEPTVTINNLTGATEYTYYIRAYHEDAGVSQECIDYTEITFTTADCDDVPTDITYTADLNSITVSWTAAAPTATIKLFMDEEGAHMAGSYPGAESPYRISGGLDKNTTYYIQILADGTCASPIIPVKTEDVEVDIVEWYPQGIIVDINTDETVGVTLENEVSYGSGLGTEATELFFSKYYEASYNVKLVAIYNGTKNIIDLTDYIIKYGKTSWESNYITLKDFGATKGQIQPGEEIILYSYTENNADDKKILDCVHEAFPDGNWVRVTNNNNTGKGILAFGGDKTLALFKGTDIIDIIGAVNGSIPNNSKANNQPSWGDANGWICDEGLSLADDSEIGISTNRCLLVRNNTVTSGANAVASNTTDFVTLCSEWKGAHVLDSDVDNGIQESCENFAYVGTFDYSDYYTKYESMGEGTTFEEKDRNPDGTVTIEIPDLYKHACSNIRVKLTNSNGEVLSDREYKVPIMITTTQGTDGQTFLDLQQNLATKEVDGEGNVIDTHPLSLEEVREICKTCDVVVRDNATLTKIADDAANDHPQVRNVYVYENSSLIVPNGTNYTINNLSLRRNQDAVASVSAYPDALKLPESAAAPISLDFRLSADNWHWFTLPYDCNINEVTWADGTPAQYNTDWYLMTYDGEKRAETQAGGCWKAYTGTIINAGDGFIIAINGNINNPAHTYELRFPMSKDVLAAEGTDKTVDVRAWGVETNIRPNHKGWNLVGNPYLAYYQRNNITNFEGLRLGQLTGPDPQTGYWEQTGDVPYVVVPVGAGWIAYEQVLASETDLLPFTAYFVQVGNDGTHNSTQDLKVAFDHTKLQLSATPMPASIIQRATSETEVAEPVIVGVSLTNSLGESDKTSLVIDNQFTDEYEMNADFFKWFGDYYKYYTKPVVYSLGADNGKRAFNALSEDLATQPVSLGMYVAQAGNYTFTLDRRSDLSKVQEVWLYDATQDQYTNLMQDSYTFNTAKTESAGRFFLSVKMAPKVSTDINNVTDGTIWATTQDHTIFVNGLLSNAQLWIYDATGKLLHTDQTQYYQHTYQVPVSGTYFVRVQNTMQTQTIKVVVE